MRGIIDKFALWFMALRGYSLPISVMSWLVPFLFASLNGGNILYGIIALFGIIILHLATNIFDDTVDYIRAKNDIDRGLKSDFNFQKGKCFFIFNNDLTIKDYIRASLILFIFSMLIALFFIYIYGIELLLIIIPTIILCILYPLLGCLGFGEIIVALVFSPLLYLGVYFVMTGSFSADILLISISTGLLSVAVLHNHMLLDFECDKINRKTTLCGICKTKQRALYLLGIIIFCSYLNICICVIFKLLSPYYLISLFSLPTAITLYKVMNIHIENPETEIVKNIFMGNTKEIEKAPKNQRNFLLKFIIVRNLLSLFTLLICISVILSEIL